MSHTLWSRPGLVIGILSALGLLTAVACGASATPTPLPTNTPTVTVISPTATAVPPTATPTSQAVVVATPTATSVPTPTPTPSVTPKRGGVVNQTAGDDPPSWDGITAASAGFSVYTAKVYSNLLWNPQGNVIVPDAAASYSISGDGLTWTFKLLPTVKFQTGYTPANPRDGTAMTSQDVKYSLEKMMGLHTDPISVRCGWIKEFIDTNRPDNGLEVVDNLTLKVHLVQPFAALANALVVGMCDIVPDGITLKEMAQRPYGTGPFRLKSAQHGAAYVFERNPDYFKPGLPYLDGWKMSIIVDQSVTQAAFLTGKLDLSAGNPTPDNKALYDAAVKNGTVYLQVYDTGCRPAGIFMNSLKPPFDNLQLRQAVNLALDRQAWSKIVNNGYDTPTLALDTGGFGKTVDQIMQLPGWRQPHDADLAQAKQMVKSLYPNGLDVTMMVRNLGSGYSSYPTENEFTAGELKKIGINATLQLLDSATALDRAAKIDYTIWSYWVCQTTGTPEELFGSYFVTGGSRNYFGFSDPKLDSGYHDMAGTADPVLRKQKAQALEQIVMDKLPYAPAPVNTGMRQAHSYVRDVPITITFYNWDKDELIWRSDV